MIKCPSNSLEAPVLHLNAGLENDGGTVGTNFTHSESTRIVMPVNSPKQGEVGDPRYCGFAINQQLLFDDLIFDLFEHL